jgi:dephospho-CoA kinase
MIPQIGLTGNIGSGKSTVARHLAELGAAVIDADVLARAATDDPQVLAAIAAELGAELVVDGRLDRAATAARVFGDDGALERLNAIVHPWVGREREARVAALLAADDPPPLIVHDVPLLYEVGLDGAFDAVVVVDAPLEVRVARVVARSGLSPDEVRARDAAQMPLAEKVARADHVLDNGGGVASLSERVRALWPGLIGATGGWQG